MTTLASWDGGALPNTGGTAPTVSGDEFTTAVNALSYGYWTLGAAAPTNSLRFRFKTPSAWPSASFTIATVSAGAGSILNRMNLGGSGAPGQVRLVRQAGTQVAASSTGAIDLSTWYRGELQMNSGGNLLRCAVFPLGSDVALWESGAISGATGATGTRLSLGNGANGASPPATIAAMSFSHFLATDTYGAWLGRDEDDPLPPPDVGSYRFFNGTTLLDLTPRGEFDGTVLHPVEVRGYWDGTALHPLT